MSRLIDKEPPPIDSKPLKVVVAGLSRTGTACSSFQLLFYVTLMTD